MSIPGRFFLSFKKLWRSNLPNTRLQQVCCPTISFATNMRLVQVLSAKTHDVRNNLQKGTGKYAEFQRTTFNSHNLLQVLQVAYHAHAPKIMVSSIYEYPLS
jgi:hypothetical protein